jgi:hypothetical protein
MPKSAICTAKREPTRITQSLRSWLQWSQSIPSWRQTDLKLRRQPRKHVALLGNFSGLKMCS